ncbi:TfoX/Sxy family protein [Parasphingopyxis lamellibrachiae]|uniref:TfoX-like protein n=1 Tax=Parasphingopyxis lamellibrachiae TaxID=680125 RepID=A0A3D9FH82_9SPHN|nr:TfoX/Sxy family protein [Parasphingopyxis lamellibrachiae]RED16446.1 TfoX-like protein [Parasphingopyxis lamellibrachiae]
MAYDPHLADELEAAFAARPDVERKAMFGGYCWMLNGNMLCGVEVGRFMFRVGKDLQAEALERPGAELVNFNGRKMGGIIWVEEHAAREAGLENWIAMAERFVGSLPPK